MTNTDLAAVIIALAVIVLSAHLLGHLFERLHQPRLVGEILAGVMLGPFVLGSVAPEALAALLGTEGTHHPRASSSASPTGSGCCS